MIKRRISIALMSSVALVAVVSTLLGAFAFAAMRSGPPPTSKGLLVAVGAFVYVVRV